MKKAFTLVELLIVVGILGILIGVLLGTFGGVSDSARATKCMANLRNLGMAVQSYAMESGAYPSTWISPTDGKDGAYISPYEGTLEDREYALTNGPLWKAVNRSRDCYVCPTHQRYVREHNLGQDPLWSYAKNPGASGAYGSFERAEVTLLFAELPFAEVKNGEFTQTGQLSGEALDPVLDAPNPNGEDGEKGGNEAIGFNHKSGKNYFAHICYADGHVAKLIAPKAGSAADLTSWLCYTTVGGESGRADVDITFDGTQYKKVTATE